MGGGLAATEMERTPGTGRRRGRVVLMGACSVADAYGELRHWHATSGTCLSTLHEAGNQILAVAFRADGQLFASAGLDCAVRVYSEASRRLLHTLTQG